MNRTPKFYSYPEEYDDRPAGIYIDNNQGQPEQYPNDWGPGGLPAHFAAINALAAAGAEESPDGPPPAEPDQQ